MPLAHGKITVRFASRRQRRRFIQAAGLCFIFAKRMLHFFDSEVFRNFADAFRAFRVPRQIRTNESLPPGGRGTTKWWKEPARHCNLVKLYGKALSLTRLRQEPSARVASIACFPLWLKICHRHIFLTRRAHPEGAYLCETLDMFIKLWYNK